MFLLLLLSLARAGDPVLLDLTTSVRLGSLAVDGRRVSWAADGRARVSVESGRHEVVLFGAMGRELVRTWVHVREPRRCTIGREAPVVRCEDPDRR